MQGDEARLHHALEAAEKILLHAADESPASLRADERLQFTLVHLLEILGEACNHISSPCKAGHPEVPWQDVVDMRHRLIHGYFDINLDIVWNTVQDAVPRLRRQLQAVLDAERLGPS